MCQLCAGTYLFDTLVTGKAPTTIMNVRSETVKCVNAMFFSSQANDERGLILKAKPRKQMVGGSHNNNAML